MINAVEEGYIKHEDVIWSTPRTFSSPESAALYKWFCESVDWYRDMEYGERMSVEVEQVGAEDMKSYRYDYHPKLLKKAGKIVGCSVQTSDIGE